VNRGYREQARVFTGNSTAKACQIRPGFAVAASRHIPVRRLRAGFGPVGIKKTGLVEYRFRPDSLDVRDTKAPGRIDVDLDKPLKL